MSRLRSAALAAAVLALASAATPSGGVAAQQTRDVRVSVRPERVRVGDPVIVTVRVQAERWPDEVSLDVEGVAELVEHRDRTSSGVGARGAVSMVLERDFLLRPLGPGRLALPPVSVAWGEERIERPVPGVEVADAGVAWVPARGRREPRAVARADVRDPAREPARAAPPPRREPSPEPAAGHGASPGAVAPGFVPGAYGGPVPDPTAPRVDPSRWAEAPWGSSIDGGAWEEMVPLLETFQQQARDRNGLAVLEAGVVPLRAYVGQQVTLVASATFLPEAAARLGAPPEFVPGRASDAVAVDLPWAPAIPAAAGSAATAAGAGETHSFMRAFFPLRPGPLTVEGPTLLYSVGSRARGRPPLDTLALAPMQVEVLPVPRAGAPAGWTGAVGRYAVRAHLEPAHVRVGEPAYLTLEVSGVGYLPQVARPPLARLWGAELRPTGEQTETDVRDGVVGGRKLFTWMVVPVQPGAVPIGPILFPFFDPWTGGFAQALTTETTLVAEPR